MISNALSAMTRRSVPDMFTRSHLRRGIDNNWHLVVRTQSFVGKSVLVRVPVSFDLVKRAINMVMRIRWSKNGCLPAVWSSPQSNAASCGMEIPVPRPRTHLAFWRLRESMRSREAWADTLDQPHFPLEKTAITDIDDKYKIHAT